MPVFSPTNPPISKLFVDPIALPVIALFVANELDIVLVDPELKPTSPPIAALPVTTLL